MGPAFPRVAAVAVLVLGVLGACGGDESSPTDAGNTYSSGQHEYEITGPGGWLIQDVSPTVVIFKAPPVPGDAFNDYLSVTVDDFKDGPSLEQYFNTGLLAAKESLRDFELIQQEDVRLGDEKSTRINYRGTAGQTKVQLLQAFATRKGKGYLVSFAADDSQFDQFRPAAESALDSFRFS